jgi:hypothetical protein
VKLALVLFATMLVTHYGYEPLAGSQSAAQAWFYVLRGIEGVVLFGAIIALLPRSATPALAVCLWGIWEEGQTAACRLAHGINNLPTPERWQGLCDAITGWPIYMLTLSIVAALAIYTYRGNNGA